MPAQRDITGFGLGHSEPFDWSCGCDTPEPRASQIWISGELSPNHRPTDRSRRKVHEMGNPSPSNRPRSEPGARLRWFEKGELRCAWPPCGTSMPAGYYGKQKRIFHCSHSCAQNCSFARKRPLKCLFCGKVFSPRRSNGGKPFCSAEHFRAWQRNRDDKSRFGRFATVVGEFLQDSKARLLSDGSLRQLRGNLAAFFEFIIRNHVRLLETITPDQITAFMAEHRVKRPKSGGSAAVDLHTFFDWALRTRRRKAANPVVLSFHGSKRPHREPRPYSRAELARIRSMVKNDALLRLAVEIGVESGLRISETCNLRTTDYDLERQHFFVRLPTKTRSERYVPFATRTKNALQAWIKQRPTASHDYLLVGRDNKPLRKYTLRNRLKNLLRGAEGLDRFSYHRLRHTASSAAYPAMDVPSLMKTFGWQSQSVMQGYTKVDGASVRRSYSRAMDRTAVDASSPVSRSESLEAYFEGAGTPK